MFQYIKIQFSRCKKYFSSATSAGTAYHINVSDIWSYDFHALKKIIIGFILAAICT